MNITLIALNSFVNDARVHKEAKTLATAGHDVTVVALWRLGLAETETPPDGYRVIRIRLRTLAWRGRLFAPLAKYLEFCWKIWRLAKRMPAQVYHANDASTLPAAWFATQRNHAKLIYDAHELETGRNFGNLRLSGIYRRIWSWPERLFIHRADAVLTVSEGIARELAALYGLSPAPVVILNCPESRTVHHQDHLRRKLGIAASSSILLYQGGVIEGRGLETFFQAVQQLPEKVVGVVLGDGSALTRYREEVHQGRWHRLHLPGMIPLAELHECSAGADIGVLLTQGNGCRNHELSMPNKLFEYLHAGLPIVGSDLPEIGRFIREHEVGELADPNRPETVAAAVRRLLDDPAYYHKIRENTRKAAQLFTWEREGAKLLAVYQRLLPS